MLILQRQKYKLLNLIDQRDHENIFILLMNRYFTMCNDFLHEDDILTLLEKSYHDFNDCNHDKK